MDRMLGFEPRGVGSIPAGPAIVLFKYIMHNQELLNNYFANNWKAGRGGGITSPEEISKFIKDDEWVLDVGCGDNPFKKIIKNVVGVDPAFDQADVKCTIEEYIPHRLFDVAICLGSINFGDINTIENQISKVVSCLKPVSRIYWRLNPGRHDHNNEECLEVPFFPWTFEILRSFAEKHNYTQPVEEIDAHILRPRLYAEWHRTS